MTSLSDRCFLSMLDFAPEDLQHNLQLSAELKAHRGLGREAATSAALEGTYIALLFEKPSLRTRSTFEIAIGELGGSFIDPAADVALGKRECHWSTSVAAWSAGSRGPSSGPTSSHGWSSWPRPRGTCAWSMRSATRSIPVRRSLTA